MQMFQATVPDEPSCNVEASFAEFCGCSQYSQVTAFMAGKICRLEVCRTDAYCLVIAERS